MILDKTNLINVLWKKVPLWSLFGLANVFCYGLSLMQKEEDYLYYFAYKGEGAVNTQLRANFGSNKVGNVAWTAPSLILLGHHFHSRLGPMKMFKFACMALPAIMFFQSSFNPSAPLGEATAFHNRRIIKVADAFQCFGANDEYSMGADQLAASLWFLLFF